MKKSQKLDLENRDKFFNFGLMPDVEFGYINIYERDITNSRKAEQQLGRMTLERNWSKSEVKLATLTQEVYFPEYAPTFQSMNFCSYCSR